MSFLLKWAALVTMTVDHIGAVFGWSGLNLIPFAVSQPMRIIGRAAFPLYAYSLAVGWQRTRNRGRYLGNLAACAVFSQLPFTLALYGANLHPADTLQAVFRYEPVYALLGLGLAAAIWWLLRSCTAAGWCFLAAALAGLRLKAGGTWLWAGDDLNVLYTLALAAACLGVEGRWRSWKPAQRAVSAAALAAGLVLLGPQADYGTGFVGVLLVVGLALLGRARRAGPAQAAFVLAWGVVFYGFYQQNWPMLAGLLLPAVLLAASDFAQAPHASAPMTADGTPSAKPPAHPSQPLPSARWGAGWKHFFYAWYPAHLFVLGILRVCWQARANR